MKQETVKLPSGEFLIAGNFPETSRAFVILPNGELRYYAPYKWRDEELPPGSWQLLGADPTRLTEVEAGEIVGKVTVEIDVPLRSGGPLKYGMFKNYTTDDQFNFACPVATLSLDSLAASLGISKPYCVLKNIEK